MRILEVRYDEHGRRDGWDAFVVSHGGQWAVIYDHVSGPPKRRMVRCKDEAEARAAAGQPVAGQACEAVPADTWAALVESDAGLRYG